MKKTIISSLVLASVIFTTSCGGSKDANTNNESVASDSATKTQEPLPVEQPKEVVKNYAYYVELIKGIVPEGAQLSQYYSNSDTTSKSFEHIMRVTNGAAVGYDKIGYSITRAANYMGEQKEKMENYNMESFKYFMNLNREKNAGNVNEQEYKSGESVFYYGTTKNIKGSMGSKDKNMVTMVTKINDLIITCNVDVNDVKSEMEKAIEVAKKIADTIAK